MGPNKHSRIYAFIQILRFFFRMRWELRQRPSRHHCAYAYTQKCKICIKQLALFDNRNVRNRTAPKCHCEGGYATPNLNAFRSSFQTERKKREKDNDNNVDKHFHITPWLAWPNLYIFIFMYLKSCYSDNVLWMTETDIPLYYFFSSSILLRFSFLSSALHFRTAHLFRCGCVRIVHKSLPF